MAAPSTDGYSLRMLEEAERRETELKIQKVATLLGTTKNYIMQQLVTINLIEQEFKQVLH